ncbi:MAG: DUF1194 domain-containing protein [Verrucomicrobia bacterium]|nr:DUF1194 domain-containing protein [Verrucomicrobiota bacterium]
MRKQIIVALLALAATVSSVKAVKVELALCIDASGSIGTPDFNNQKNGYVNALNDIFTTDPGFYGTVAISVFRFASSVTQILATTEINNPADLATLTGAIAAMAYPGGSTALGPAIQAAANELLNNTIASDRQVIDVSTDGFGNVGIGQVAAASAAIAAGIEQINGLGVGGGANLNFVMGAGAFGIQVNDFGQQFEDALKGKLQKEINGVPDAGNSLALLILGLAMIGLAPMRRIRLA